MKAGAKNISKSDKPKFGDVVITAGVTSDGKFSLAINDIDGVPCLAVHKCTMQGGLHYSCLDGRSVVTYISLEHLRGILAMAIDKRVITR